MKNIILLTLIFCVLLNALNAQKTVYHPTTVTHAVYFDVSPPLRDMKMINPLKKSTDLKEVPNKIGKKEYCNLTSNIFRLPEDPVWQKMDGINMQQSVVPIQNFEGINNISGFYPPDTQGDVGPDNYVQVVNSNFAVYSKTGTTLFGPAALHTIWNGIPSPWNGTDDGDPIVLYDQAANRWIISQFSLPTGNYAELIAVSQTADPAGAWYRYVFQYGNEMPDYPKFGVWPDAYYMSINQFTGGSTWGGVGACAFERAKMLVGDPSAAMVYFNLGPTGDPWSMLPADWDGITPPAANEPNPFVYYDDWTSTTQDFLKVWEFHVDWVTPANSTFALVSSLVTAPFKSEICTATRGQCIPQPGTTVKLESLSDRMMFPLQYRKFASYRSMVTNHTVDVDNTGHAGIRWYELRNTGTGWSIYQQGTYAPDNNHRWVGSIAMNDQGHIALGYSVSSNNTVYPGIRYTGRKATDPLGQMTIPEQTVINGSGSQTGTAARWGDYSMMSVDPSDNKTFWYTTEYIQNTGTASWRTRIAAFLIKNDPTVSTLPATAVTNTSAILNGTVNPNGLATTYYFEWGTTLAYGNNTLITAAGSGVTTVTVSANIIGLTPGTTYHNRLVAVNTEGTANGNDVIFIPGAAVISTNPVTGIAITSATGGGNVTSEGGSPVTARGVCWGIASSPTISDDHTSDGAGPGTFTSTITGLVQNTFYYLRAYATNGFGTFYGDEVQFQTLCGNFPLPFNEPFSTTLIPNCWTQHDHQGNGQVWQFGTITGYSSNPNLTGNYAFLNSDDYGSGNSQNVDLISPSLNLSSYSVVNLQFKHYFRNWAGEICTVSYSINNGSSWSPIQSFTSTTANPATFSQVIVPVAGQSQVKFKWNYSGSYGYYWAVDDVSITGTIPVPLAVTPSSRTLGPMSGSTTFAVATAVPWTATSTQPWCSVSQSGTGSGTMTATCASNVGSTSRTATITVAIEGNPPVIVTIIQSGLVPPTNLAGSLNVNSVHLTWNKPSASNLANVSSCENTNVLRMGRNFIPENHVGPVGERANNVGIATSTPFRPTLSSNSDAASSVLFDNGPLVNSPGTGSGGKDESVLFSPLTFYGFGAQQTLDNSMADDFIVPAGSGWDPAKFIFYAYQTGSTNTSSITGLFFRIYNGDPTAGGTVIWGDLITNRMTATSWSNIYRTDAVGGATDRPIMQVEAAISGLYLAPGTYWVEYQFTGSVSFTGPWVPPVTITGILSTGNAKQNTGGWTNAMDGNYQQGVPFIIEGSIAAPPQGLIGYNIYRNGTPVHYNSGPDAINFNDSYLPLGTYNYHVTSKYDLTLYGFPGQYGESAQVGPYQATISQNPARVDLTDYIITNGQFPCYSATQFIYVAGNGSSFLVQPGGSVTLISGGKIFLLPGTVVQPQGYLHGYITATGSYCSQLPNALLNSLEVSDIEIPDKLFRIYPNPTTGNFTLELKLDKTISNLLVRIYNMMGVEILRKDITGSHRMEFSLGRHSSGIYIINVIGDGFEESFRLIKQ